MATKTIYRSSPIGSLDHPWVSKADTKYNADGLFKAPLVLSGKDAADLVAIVDAEVDAHYDEMTKDMTPGERKKWGKAYPYEVLEDADGNPTGETKFNFKQNQTIRLKDGTSKVIAVMVVDSAGKDLKKPVFHGSEGRVMYAIRPIKMESTKKFSVRLDFAGVQITKLSSGGGGGARFGAVEGGYVGDDDEGGDDAPFSGGGGGSGPASTDGDY